MNALHNKHIQQSLAFEYIVGAVSPIVPGLISPWWTLPNPALSHISDGDWRIEREDVAPFIVRAGEAFYMPAGVRHRLFMVTEGVTVSRWAHFNIFVCDYLEVSALFDLPLSFSGDVAQRMGVVLEGLASPDKEINWLLASVSRKQLEFELTSLLLGSSPSKFSGEFRIHNLQRILPVLDVIHQNLTDKFTREHLASHVYLSPSRFAAIFKETMGLSPIDYINKVRMQRAQQLLINTHLRIEQVATEVGYDDAHYFSRLFRTHYSLSPQQYRATVLKNGPIAARLKTSNFH